MDTKPPLVSIILPCYNSERYLADTLKSVTSQTYTNWELIAVDDCSQDKTLEILMAAAREDIRIKVLSHKTNAGKPAPNKNTALKYASGEYIQFIDHDDFYLPQKTEVLAHALLSNKDCVAAFGNLRYTNSRGEDESVYLSNFPADAADCIERLSGNMTIFKSQFFIFQATRYAALHTISCMIARNRLRDVDLNFDEKYIICDDVDMWMRVSISGKLVYVNQVLAKYRIHLSNLTSDSINTHRDMATYLN